MLEEHKGAKLFYKKNSSSERQKGDTVIGIFILGPGMLNQEPWEGSVEGEQNPRTICLTVVCGAEAG